MDVIKTNQELLKSLPKRTRDVIERRFGIGKKKTEETLESIGSSYGITRERVRQIEAHGLKKLRNLEVEKEHEEVFGRLKAELERRGGVGEEQDVVASLAASTEEQNHIRFLLTLGKNFVHVGEGAEFSACWALGEEQHKAAKAVLAALSAELEKGEPIEEHEMKGTISRKAGEMIPGEISDEAAWSWLSLSKRIGKNKLGEWGIKNSPHISPRGVRDLAYLVMKRHGSPLHFSEVALLIKKNLGEHAHVQTVHNELIKDSRFVLVGRGLYALSEWGYKPGTIRDVLASILNAHGPMRREDLIEKVLRERHVKPATVQINLQNRKYFKVLEDGRYTASA